MVKNATKVRFTAPLQWSTAIITSNPIFSDLQQLFKLNACADWPDIPALNGWRAAKDYQFVDNALLAADGRYYEHFIFETQQIPTRAENWHDFFGALIWCLFPKTKALLNQLHMAEIAEHGQQQRSKLRNKLTLLDECGVLVCLEPEQLEHSELLRQHQWQQSFVTKRSDWWQGVRPVIFGHAIYEMATMPFIGLTAKCWFMPVPAGFGHWSLTDTYTFLDEKLAQQIANTSLLLDNQQLTPLPLLGIPGWYAANSEHRFYSNVEYFRPKRTAQQGN
ncbi:hypothetical protein GCM10010919_15650 [Alishewanella longhuensis]|uniref:DUF3025 domain-containing protein n=1 Tax=Alishewanella longhuensis TaxID=1091037 RepID=A0ABQ3KYN6_9ALTE|nr:DUF3025 domain-containing protein [Alishewanella longhuensis]GHG67159.1 hypothetical protein GCM10010919_15650 [Alishewanella longhuensis]